MEFDEAWEKILEIVLSVLFLSTIGFLVYLILICSERIMLALNCLNGV